MSIVFNIRNMLVEARVLFGTRSRLTTAVLIAITFVLLSSTACNNAGNRTPAQLMNYILADAASVRICYVREILNSNPESESEYMRCGWNLSGFDNPVKKEDLDSILVVEDRGREQDSRRDRGIWNYSIVWGRINFNELKEKLDAHVDSSGWKYRDDYPGFRVWEARDVAVIIPENEEYFIFSDQDSVGKVTRALASGSGFLPEEEYVSLEVTSKSV